MQLPLGYITEHINLHISTLYAQTLSTGVSHCPSLTAYRDCLDKNPLLWTRGHWEHTQCQLAEVRGLVSPPPSPFLKGRVKGGGVLEVACTSRPVLTDHAVTKWNTAEERKKKRKDYKCPTVNLL